jgi:hypothetical protein
MLKIPCYLHQNLNGEVKEVQSSLCMTHDKNLFISCPSKIIKNKSVAVIMVLSWTFKDKHSTPQGIFSCLNLNPGWQLPSVLKVMYSHVNFSNFLNPKIYVHGHVCLDVCWAFFLSSILLFVCDTISIF